MKDFEFMVWKKLIQWRIQKLNLERNEMLKSIINHKTQMFGQSRSIYCTVTMLTLKYLMHWTNMVLAQHLKMLPSPKVAQNLADNLIVHYVVWSGWSTNNDQIHLFQILLNIYLHYLSYIFISLLSLNCF